MFTHRITKKPPKTTTAITTATTTKRIRVLQKCLLKQFTLIIDECKMAVIGKTIL